MITAIITGASSGLGAEFARQIIDNPQIESVWLIARRKERLEELAHEIGAERCFVLPLDLTNDADYEHFTEMLKETQPEIKYLINNAGFAKLGNFCDVEPSYSTSQVELNCVALTKITALSPPYIIKGGEIINIASVASFAPNTRLSVYSSTKAFVYSLSRGLREEFKPKGINVLAVCPGPMDTEFLEVANIPKGASATFDRLPHVKVRKVVKGALKASKKKKAVFTKHILYKFYRVLAKVLPKSLVMKFCKA